MRRGGSPGSRSATAVGVGAFVASWAFGSTPVAVVGAGFLVAAGLSRLWAAQAAARIHAERLVLSKERIEGGELVVELRIARSRWLPVGSAAASQRLGANTARADVDGRTSRLVFDGIVRGRHELPALELVARDPLGLERVVIEVGRTEVVLVRPRIPHLSSVFTHLGAHEAGSARSLRRPTGFEIHAVRDYTPGEPLRAVHWPTTARRGRLMVKELDDAPRNDLVVILDEDPDGVAGPPLHSSFDAAVRAAGALALAEAQAHRRVSIVCTTQGSVPIDIHSPGSDWETALDRLAAVTPTPGARIDATLRHPGAAVARARELIVVTGRPDRAVAALLEVRLAGRAAAIVAVASETFAGATRNRADPALLRAAAAGIRVAIVEAGIPIEHALARRHAENVGA